MTTKAGERKRRYSMDEITNIITSEQLTGDDFDWLCALSTYAVVVDNPVTKNGAIAGMRSVCVTVIHTDMFPTGYFFDAGLEPVIVINDETSILDYDFISDLHPMHDWEIYLWLSHPWAVPETPLGIYGEWYRSDTYKDGIMPFDGKTLGWEDQPPVVDKIGEEDE